RRGLSPRALPSPRRPRTAGPPGPVAAGLRVHLPGGRAAFRGPAAGGVRVPPPPGGAGGWALAAPGPGEGAHGRRLPAALRSGELPPGAAGDGAEPRSLAGL